MLFRTSTTPTRIEPKNYLYIIPCYNESRKELTDTLNSLVNQSYLVNDKRSLLIICDGRIKGQGNSASTDNILKKILKITDLDSLYTYTTWDNKVNPATIYTGTYKSLPFILIIKQNNYGKRDSLVLVRSRCYEYNKQLLTVDDDIMNDDMIINNLKTIYETKIDYIIGIDADTIFDYNCSTELIRGIEKDDMIQGCVGYVDISPEMNRLSPFVLYQYAEYMFAQCLKRYAQSNLTQKVTCLSGCVQILRVSEQTCGEKILKIFNYLPKEDDHIFKHIRSYASEDRNHVCHMLSLYPDVKTTQALEAIAYTTVPTSIAVFLSQRRRWSLGANTNDLMLVYLPGINIFERISAFVNVLTFSVTPFIFIATALFIKSIIEGPTMLMLYLSVVMIIPHTYALIVPIYIKKISLPKMFYYYISLLFFTVFSGLINLIIYFYANFYMDVIKWGKTRQIDKEVEKYDFIVSYEFIDDDIDNLYLEILSDDTIEQGYIELLGHDTIINETEIMPEISIEILPEIVETEIMPEISKVTELEIVETVF
jgi:chitin synthase